MTTSIAEPYPQRPQRPVLRRLVDFLPATAPVTPEPLPTTALPAPDPTASIVAERVLRAVVETISGRRPAQQLSTMLRPDLLASLTSLQATAAPLQPRVRKSSRSLTGSGGRGGGRCRDAEHRRPGSGRPFREAPGRS